MEHGVIAPRVAFVPFPYNLPMGEAGDREEHRRVARAALALLYKLDQPGEVSISASQHFG
jgi:D-proline reductase (dithiol) PrdB